MRERVISAGALLVMVGSWVVWSFSAHGPGWWITLVVMIVATAGYLGSVALAFYLRWYARRVQELRYAREACEACQQSGSLFKSPRGEFLILCAAHHAAAPRAHRWKLSATW